MKVSTKVSNCASCGAVVNPRWGECLSCGIAVLDGQAALSVEQVANTPQVQPDKRPPMAAPRAPATITTVTDKLGATWGHEVAALIRWFRSATPPAAAFELQIGVTIVRPDVWWQSIHTDIADGPGRARGRTGALAGDLAKLYRLFGDAS